MRPTVSTATLHRIFTELPEPRCLCRERPGATAGNLEINRDELVSHSQQPPAETKVLDGGTYREGEAVVFTERFHLRRGYLLRQRLPTLSAHRDDLRRSTQPRWNDGFGTLCTAFLTAAEKRSYGRPLPPNGPPPPCQGAMPPPTMAARVATGVRLKQTTPTSPGRSPRQAGSEAPWTAAGVVSATDGGTGRGSNAGSLSRGQSKAKPGAEQSRDAPPTWIIPSCLRMGRGKTEKR